MLFFAGRLQGKALAVEDEYVRLLNVPKLKSLLLNRSWNRWLSVLRRQLDRNELLAVEIRVTSLTEALLNAGQEIAELQYRVEPHLGQS